MTSDNYYGSCAMERDWKLDRLAERAGFNINPMKTAALEFVARVFVENVKTLEGLRVLPFFAVETAYNLGRAARIVVAAIALVGRGFFTADSLAFPDILPFPLLSRHWLSADLLALLYLHAVDEHAEVLADRDQRRVLVVKLHAQRSVHRLRDFGNRGGRLVVQGPRSCS